MSPRLSFYAICLIVLGPVSAQDYQGAAKLLERMSSANEKPLDAPGLLKRDIALFNAEARKLEPQIAAKRWLELFDAFSKISQRELEAMDYRQRLSAKSLIEALPPSSAWDALATLIAARPNDESGKKAVLNLLIWTLRGQPGDVTEILAGTESAMENSDSWMERSESWRAEKFEKLSGALRSRVGIATNPVSEFRKSLDTLEKDRESGTGYLIVPRLTDSPDAESLLTRFFKAGATVGGFAEDTTRELAVKLVMTHPDLLRRAEWGLVSTTADAPLFELLEKRFPKGDDDEYRNAADVYLSSLIEADHTAKARSSLFEQLADASRPNRNLLASSSVNEGLAAKSRKFLEDLLVAIPELPFWDNYFSLSLNGDATKNGIAFLQTSLDKMPEDFRSRMRGEIEKYQRDAHFGAGEVDQGVAVIRERLKAGPVRIPEVSDVEKASIQARLEALGIHVSPQLLRNLTRPTITSEDADSRYFHLALQLAEIGRLKKNPEWVNEGLAAATARVGSQDVRGLVAALIQNGRGVDAEKLAIDQLLKLCDGNGQSSYKIRSVLSMLVYIYREAGRPEDIVKLLDNGSFWNVSDLAALNGEAFESIPLQLMAAEALAKAGKKEDALRIVRWVLQNEAGHDSVYQMLLTLAPPDLEQELDRLYANNRFEERPLVWKAKVQLDAGRVDEAEKTIRAAIAVDPSDGEQGKGDRMRAYSVLAEILDKKGDTEQAKTMRGVVEAIRISEDADDYAGAGLEKEAVEMYQQALTHFADAYCIQSRLAMRYSDLGEMENAEKHYQRAFELMPSSFGRVESHCFGCEGIFSSEKSQGVADRVFTRLAKEMPDKAQVFYLLGYLREAQGRKSEAIVEYRRAVALDPDYVNAWAKIAASAGDADLPSNERDEAMLATFRLGQATDVDAIANLPRLWDAILEKEASLPKPMTGPIYPLAASKNLRSGSDDFASRSDRGRLRESMTSNTIISSVEDIFRFLLTPD